MDLVAGWQMACPSCRSALASSAPERQSCSGCGAVFRREAGVWRLLGEGREEVFRDFIERYEIVRDAEGRRMQRPDHLRALPFRDLSRKRPYEWHIRSTSFAELLRRVIEPLESARAAPLNVLDLGSGLGWLAYRLASRGHHVAAVDLVVNESDGLGVHIHYDRAFTPVQAEFERLPFPGGGADVVIYNAAFHYATDYGRTLREALRVLARGGRVVIMDTPVYRDGASGQAMVKEREASFEGVCGSGRGVVTTEGFLTYARLEALASDLAVSWRMSEPWRGLRWWMKPWVARLRRSREPARFKLIVGARRAEW
jgi:SAM-dependent methyltransferase